MLPVLATIKRTMVLPDHFNDYVDMKGSGFIEKVVMAQYSSSVHYSPSLTRYRSAM